jgi:hypothetical protein
MTFHCVAGAQRSCQVMTRVSLTKARRGQAASHEVRRQLQGAAEELQEAGGAALDGGDALRAGTGALPAEEGVHEGALHDAQQAARAQHHPAQRNAALCLSAAARSSCPDRALLRRVEELAGRLADALTHRADVVEH